MFDESGPRRGRRPTPSIRWLTRPRPAGPAAAELPDHGSVVSLDGTPSPDDTAVGMPIPVVTCDTNGVMKASEPGH